MELNRLPADSLNSEALAETNPPGKCTMGGETKNNSNFCFSPPLSFLLSFPGLCSQVVREFVAQRRSEGRRDPASYHSEADERIQQVPQAFL